MKHVVIILEWLGSLAVPTTASVTAGYRGAEVIYSAPTRAVKARF